jgi:glycosyltransferase involved in cell wall biosynthesis
LRLPPLAHASVSDEASLIGLLRLLGRIPASSAVGEWMHAIVASRGFAEQARVRFSLRWIAFWADSVFRDVAARDALRTIYGDEGAREQLLADDRDGAARLGLDPGLGVGARLHGLDRVSARPRAFAVSTVPVARRRAATPDVTVVIPSYNHERYVEDAIGSVLTQTYEAFRVVVSDDCSTDATVERARAVGDDRVRVLARTRNVGLGNNLRAALAAVDTPYVAILNSDDLFHPERLERCRTALERRPEAALAATDLTLVDVRGRVLTPESTSALLDGPEVVGSVTWYYRARQETAQARSLAEALLEQNFLATSSNVFCRTAFLRDRIDGLADLKYCVDWQLFLDAAIDDALVHIPEELLAYRLHDTNTVWLRDRDRWPFLLEVNRVVARGVRRRLARAIEGRDKSADHSLVAGVMDRVLRNGNFDGLTLFFQGMLPEGELEALGRESAELRARLEELEGRVRRRWAMTEVWRAMGGDAHSVAALPHELRTLRVQRNAAEVEADASRDALRRAHASREWRIGRFLWNRTGLAKAALALSRAARIRDS